MRNAVLVSAAALALSAGWLVAGDTAVQGQTQPNTGFGAVAGEKGGLDITGPYEVVADWPKPLANLPGHENWTWGSGFGFSFVKSATGGVPSLR